ncbi:MAG TPA: FAD-binding oxidoreductase [Candidatus Binatia bacterium]
MSTTRDDAGAPPLVGSGSQQRAGTPADAVDGVVPARVLRPVSLGAARDAVRNAANAGEALLASGRGRHLAIGGVPERLDVLLQLDLLNRIREHAAADMTVTVEAGCTLATLAATLAEAGQWLPLDPPAPEETTVGGLIAANLSGPLRASQGTVRDLLLGLRWIAPDGALVAGGGRVVKNVAGYDLPKAHVGALGTLGVIVEATFKLRPRPEREGAVLLACADAASAVNAALAVRDAVEPGWLEIASGTVAGVDAPFAVACGFLGVAAEVEDARARARAAADGAKAEVAGALDDEPARELRARLGGFALAPAAAVLRASTLPNRLADVLDAQAPCVAHAANGVARLVAQNRENAIELVRRLRVPIERAGGALVVERATPDVKHALRELGGVWGDPGDGCELMRRLKAAFDPGRALAPGRFVADL